MTDDGLTADGLVERVRALAPMIAAAAQQAEDERQPLDEVMAALEASGVFRSFVPAQYGGFEIDLDTFIDIGVAVSEGCTSTGWVTTFCMEHNWLLAQFPRATVDDVLADRPYILAPASISPSGAARPAPDGYLVSGRWSWGTGVVHSDWVMLSGVVDDPDNTSAVPDLRMFLVPRDRVEVTDDWDSSGMAGTGSNDMIATDVPVAEGYAQSLFTMASGLAPGAATYESSTFGYPMLPFLALTAAIPALGAARRSVELFSERLGSRVLYGTMSKQAERASAQMRLAHAMVRTEQIETRLRDIAHQIESWGARALAGDGCPIEERARLRLHIAQAVGDCRDVVRNVMEASGATAQLRPHPMQRIHRDVHTMAAHTVFDLDLTAENYGRILVGLDPVGLT